MPWQEPLFNMQLFYIPSLTTSDSKAVFSKEESRHLYKVLRKKLGDDLLITNGKGSLFSGVIETIGSHICEVALGKVTHRLSLPYKLHMAVAPTKMNDRFEWFLEKATEIGVTEITPIVCNHSERKNIKLERYQKIVVAAMKQSLRTTLPLLHPLTPMEDFISNHIPSNGFIAHCQQTPKNTFSTLIKPKSDTTLLIGPEGDFSNNEIEMAMRNHYKPVTLGNMRLRTETAAIVGCHTVALANS